MNQTNTIVYVNVSSTRLRDPEFNLSALNFTWKVTGFLEDSESKMLILQLIWVNPFAISTLYEPDELVLTFNGSERLILSEKGNLSLSETSLSLIRPIRKQLD